jgi:hypothetical protein
LPTPDLKFLEGCQLLSISFTNFQGVADTLCHRKKKKISRASTIASIFENKKEMPVYKKISEVHLLVQFDPSIPNIAHPNHMRQSIKTVGITKNKKREKNSKYISYGTPPNYTTFAP